MKLNESVIKKEITSNLLFSKLESKTQMISNKNDGDCFHNRSNHTTEVLECSFMIKDVVKKHIKIDSEILESAALLHDIGHTPFGHAGEDALNDIFLSNDNLHYSETYPGLFKHNINSLKIIGEHFGEKYKKFEIMDAILKHTSPFPKNYCFNVFKEANIIKSNFILRYFEPNLSENLIKFDYLFRKNNLCKCKTAKSIGNFGNCSLCRNKGDNFGLCFHPGATETLLSEYICYPYALTYEGAIIYLADEICCFCSDLADFAIYTINNEEEMSLFIPLAKINSSIATVKALYPNNQVVLLLQDYLKLFNSGKTLDNGTVMPIINKIKNEMVNSITISENTEHIDNLFISKNKKRCFLNKKIEFCQPLLKIKDSNFKVLKIIKNAIYKDLHSIERIKKNNDIGQENIKKLVTHYIENLPKFFDDYKNVFGQSFVKKLSMSIARIIDKDLSKVSDLIQNYNDNHIDEIFGESFKMQLNIDDKGLILVKNLVKREIGYFVATLSEKDCDLLIKNILMKK